MESWELMYLHPIYQLVQNKTSRPTVLFLRGISGSGKSTVSTLLTKAFGADKTVICSADDYLMEDGVYKFELSKLSDAHKQCIKSLEASLKSPNVRYIIMDNTHTRLWHLQAAEEIARKHGSKIHYIDIVVPDKTHLGLCLNRQRHNVSKATILAQWTNWEINPNSLHIPMFVSEEEKLLLN